MRRLAIACLIATTALSAAARAQSLKLAYVDVQRAIQETEEGKAARGRLKTEFDQRRAQLDKKSADLEKMQEEFEKALLDARKSASDLQEDMNRQEQQAMGGILQRLQQVVAEIAERESISFVLDKGGLLYAPAAADITNEVVRRYNDRFGAGEKPAGKAGPKTAQPAPKSPPPPPPGKK